MLAPSVSRSTNLIPITKERSRLLLVAESPEARQRLLRNINMAEFDVTCVSALESLGRHLRDAFEAILVEVDPARLLPVLRLIRLSQRGASVPVFVECSRVEEEATLAGVLPVYRAMACSHAEMLRLLHRRLEPPTVRMHRGVL